MICVFSCILLCFAVPKCLLKSYLLLHTKLHFSHVFILATFIVFICIRKRIHLEYIKKRLNLPRGFFQKKVCSQPEIIFLVFKAFCSKTEN